MPSTYSLSSHVHDLALILTNFRNVQCLTFIDTQGDDEAVATITRLLLEKLGYKATICHDGVEAVAFYQTHWRGVDLVILDLIMPEMSGRETFFALRNINPNVRTLLASGYSLDGDAQTLLDEGAGGFIQKPYRAEELSRKVADLLAL